MTKSAKSALPSDLLTPTLGSNYGLDGFEDDSYNEGVEDHRTLSQFEEFPAFPTGLTKGAAAGLMDLSELTREAATLSNLSWLEDAFQDVERLPKNPVARGIPELEEAWGLHRPTNGTLVPALDPKAASVAERAKASKKQQDPRFLAGLVTAAMRASASGEALDSILSKAYGALGNDGHLIKSAMDRVKAEHGLVGNVFVRASAYPGYAQGKWSDHIKRTAKNARYLVVEEAALKSASWIRDGVCTMTGKKVVASVPWKEAYAFYAPRLQISGHKLASASTDSSCREALRTAFLGGVAKKAKQYEGPVVEQNVVVRGVKKATDLLAVKYSSTIRWIRQAMSEGFAGRDLDALVERRFTASSLDQAKELIGQTRQAHEGASGFIYVDAGAYASERGVAGCEEGAMKHRANAIRTLLAMERCASCAHARVLEDGTPKCGTYNKVLANPSDFGASLERVKKANIRTANASDAEVTASMFAKEFDPSEFSLHNAAMNGFDIAPLPEHEKMGEIALGGLRWGGE